MQSVPRLPPRMPSLQCRRIFLSLLSKHPSLLRGYPTCRMRHIVCSMLVRPSVLYLFAEPSTQLARPKSGLSWGLPLLRRPQPAGSLCADRRLPETQAVAARLESHSLPCTAHRGTDFLPTTNHIPNYPDRNRKESCIFRSHALLHVWSFDIGPRSPSRSEEHTSELQ